MLGRAQGVRGARRWQLGAGAQAAAARGRGAREAGGHAWRAGVARRRHGRWAARAQARGALAGARARGRVSGRRAGRAGHGRALQQARARGLGVAGRAAWAPGLALGCALGALGPFSIRFDSFFFPESPNEHRSL